MTRTIGSSVISLINRLSYILLFYSVSGSFYVYVFRNAYCLPPLLFISRFSFIYKLELFRSFNSVSDTIPFAVGTPMGLSQEERRASELKIEGVIAGPMPK